jgi:hypothetical protein
VRRARPVLSFVTTYGFLTKLSGLLANPLRTNPACRRDETIRANSKTRNSDMDIERINLIGATLADLAVRTDALRGYL